MLSLCFFVLNIDEILTCPLPLWIEEKALIVLCLGEDAGPCLEEGRGIVHSTGYGLTARQH